MSLRRAIAAVLPLPALLAPLPAHGRASVAVAVCGAADRLVTLPAREVPPFWPGEQKACAHFVCPRERGLGGPADDEE